MASIILETPFHLDALPDRPAVFLIFPRDGRPYLGRTALLRRRLKRLLEPRPGPSRFLNLRDLAVRVEYRLPASRLASSLTAYEFARRYFPDDYSSIIKLRPAAFVKVALSNQFPRTLVTTRLSASRAFHYGPFRSRASAERFEQEALDQFQVRRCQEDLVPSLAHPGCIYGEMMRCLRPCQEVVGAEEYRSEVDRLVHFLETGGRSLLETIAAARYRYSEELDFEEAKRQHQRYQRVEQTLKLSDELATSIDKLCGVAVAAGVEPGFVELRFLLQGVWLPEVEFLVAATGKEMIPMDRRLRELVSTLAPPRAGTKECAEHIALLARWYYSSWRDAEWLAFPSLEELPYRRLVRAISKAAGAARAPLFDMLSEK